LTSLQTPDGKTLAYTYDAAHKLVRVTDTLGNRVDYGYDLKGNRVSEATYDPGNTLVKSIQSSFDIRNRLSAVNNGGSLSQYLNDAVGNVAQTVTPNGYASVNGYDALNRLLQTVDALSGVTHYGYDTQDRLALVQAPNNATTQYVYDDLGNLLQEQSPDRGTTIYSYDSAGNRISHTDARGVTAFYSYDALNRPTGIDYPGSSEDVALAYDNCVGGAGRLCQAQDASGLTQYAYDAFGNVLTHTRTELGIAYTTRYTYDAANRITSITYPNGRIATYGRDVLGRIVTANMQLQATATALVTNTTHRPDGLPVSRTFGNGLTDIRQYNLKGELTYQTIGADTRLYSYDPNGNLTAKQTIPEADSYGYDALDNRFSENGQAYIYTSATNRLTQTPTGSITLDAAGNTLGDGSRSYSYNATGHLSQAGSISYTYNAQRQRTRKVVGPEVTVFHYDLAGNLIAETKADGSLIRDYVWADNAPIAQVEAGEKLTYLHADHLNTPRFATNAQGQIVWRWEGQAFGNTPANDDPDGDGTRTTVNLRFPGQYFDAETGLHYNWNRYYDPKIGRYITSDPIGLEGGLNTYTYVGSNPLHWVDQLGLVVSGRWLKKPYAHGLNVDYRGWHFDVGGWKWIPPGLRVAIVDFYGSAIISFEVECTDDDKCDKKRWTYAPDFNVGTNFGVPVRVSISHPIITAAVIAKASYNAYKLLEHWSAIQAGYYLATDPTTWCLFSGGDSK
jgi:RHS repeat-associated protein